MNIHVSYCLNRSAEVEIKYNTIICLCEAGKPHFDQREVMLETVLFLERGLVPSGKLT